MKKHKQILQALAALLALAALVWGMIALETYCQTGREQLLAEYDAALAYLAERSRTLPQQSVVPGTAQEAATCPDLACVADLALQEGDSTTQEAKRAVRAYKGISEGDVIPGEITHYCAERCCNGKWAGITADGTVLTDMDTDDLPVVGCNWFAYALAAANLPEYEVAGIDTMAKLEKEVAA
jgi:hypothetical protein